jgi:hypothetical protein
MFDPYFYEASGNRCTKSLSHSTSLPDRNGVVLSRNYMVLQAHDHYGSRDGRRNHLGMHCESDLKRPGVETTEYDTKLPTLPNSQKPPPSHQDPLKSPPTSRSGTQHQAFNTHPNDAHRLAGGSTNQKTCFRAGMQDIRILVMSDA